MPNQVIYSAVFIKKAKVYKKKFSSLVDELRKLEESLLLNPNQGTNIGADLFKIRLAVKSKGKGKSGGFRIITYFLSQNSGNFIINMLTIYDKSEESSIDKKILQQIIKYI